MNNFITIGSCLSSRIGKSYGKTYNSNCLSSTRHNRVDKIVDTYIEKTRAELPYSYLSNLHFDKNPGKDIYQQTDNQFITRQLGKTYLNPETAIGLSDIIDKDYEPDLILYDPFCDLLFKLLFSKPEGMSFFLHTRYSKNWSDFFTLESTRMPIDQIEKYYEKIVAFFTQNKRSKFIFINFPLLHHHNEEVIKRVEQINSIFSRNSFLQNHSFFIPATEIPSEYLNKKDKNHFETYQGRSIYEDYSVTIKVILDFDFSPKEWNHLAREESKNTEQFFLDNMRSKFIQQFKEFAELKHWKKYWELRKSVAKGNPFNANYQQYYTKHFNLSPHIYNNKRVLDIGCGPCGTLEWADTSLERIGLDPLADEYLKLGAKQHEMKYVQAKSESIPFENEYFDIVALLNSLAYVDDLNTTISEIKRILKPGGLLLLLTDVNKKSSIRKPHQISWNIIKKFSSELLLIDKKSYQMKDNMIYSSFKQKKTHEHLENSNKYGLLAAKFCKLSRNYK